MCERTALVFYWWGGGPQPRWVLIPPSILSYTRTFLVNLWNVDALEGIKSPLELQVVSKKTQQCFICMWEGVWLVLWGLISVKDHSKCLGLISDSEAFWLNLVSVWTEPPGGFDQDQSKLSQHCNDTIVTERKALASHPQNCRTFTTTWSRMSRFLVLCSDIKGFNAFSFCLACHRFQLHYNEFIYFLQFCEAQVFNGLKYLTKQ